jgi:hypothetical protein
LALFIATRQWANDIRQSSYVGDSHFCKTQRKTERRVSKLHYPLKVIKMVLGMVVVVAVDVVHRQEQVLFKESVKKKVEKRNFRCLLSLMPLYIHLA